MTLVTVGTQFFDGLIREVDRLAAAGGVPAPVRAQIGNTDYRPEHIEWFRFDPRMKQLMAESELVIAHGGTGTVCELIDLGVPFIAVVNTTKADNHQLEFLEDLSEVFDFCWARSEHELAAKLAEARPARRKQSETLSQLVAALSADLTGVP